MFYQSKRNSWQEVRQIGICSTKMALLTEGSASNRNLQHKNGSLARWKCVKPKFAAQRWITHPKEVLQIGVCSTKRLSYPKEVRQTWSLQHKDGSLT
ncbi:hypothetical protein MGI18_07190 [Bacillus sp. OVS6]|nr:hypothetical protein MGI18_07190 [Bacillus sp. OVS6]